jgi:uncharacterized protein
MSSYGSSETEELRLKLIEKYKDTKIEDHFNGEICETNQGSCYKITDERKLKLNTIDKSKAKSYLRNDLKIIKGIGASKEEKLKKNGFMSVDDLMEHPSYSNDACDLIEILDDENVGKLTEYVTNRYSKSHPSALYSSCFSDNNNFLFMDIETLGLKGVPLILIGVSRVESKKIVVDQYLLRNLDDELSALEAFNEEVTSDTIFVSFNGQTFDLPYIKDRLRHHGMKADLNRNHLDLMHFSRRAWKDQLPNCKLQTLEKHLFNFIREDDVPSSMVPSFYKTYLETGNIGPLVPIVEHNKEDVITLARILSRLHTELQQ